jgi:hypothetical protein
MFWFYYILGILYVFIIWVDFYVANADVHYNDPVAPLTAWKSILWPYRLGKWAFLCGIDILNNAVLPFFCVLFKYKYLNSTFRRWVNRVFLHE